MTWKTSFDFGFHKRDRCQDGLVWYRLSLTFLFQFAHAGKQFVIRHRSKLFGKRYYISIGRFHDFSPVQFKGREHASVRIVFSFHAVIALSPLRSR
ncbi:hypothetical protein ASD02_17100 [Ensifer sp. Root1252]|nr:hypothetical protein ASD00_20020 [Ensifer sp. Root31]KQW34929.1 hypothetical protein ASD02_17100 [Ensifer sp. Root1252]KRC57253.1 hypothetical protein ASE32_20415 [Ensifer sp. Root231]KRC87748.1 hypothetical protein ASE47_14570 [Ensifer sp. Root258]